MELTKYCCPNCFTNKHIKKYVVDNFDYSGNCLYCGHEGVELISIRELGICFRDCIDKAYERYDEGTGAYYDEEEQAITYSIREIMEDEEGVFVDAALDSGLVEALFENLYSARELQKGAEDIYSDIDSPEWGS